GAVEKKRAAASSPEAPRPKDERQRVASLDAGAPARSKVEAAGAAVTRSAPSEPFPAAQAPTGRSQASPAASLASSPTLRSEPAVPPPAASPGVAQSEPFRAAERSRVASNAAAPAPPAAMREGVPQVDGKLDTPSAKPQ